MKKIMIGSMVAAGAVLVAASAWAADGKDGGRWDRMDTNGDGEISAEEMSEKPAAWLEAADAEGLVDERVVDLLALVLPAVVFFEPLEVFALLRVEVGIRGFYQKLTSRSTQEV